MQNTHKNETSKSSKNYSHLTLSDRIKIEQGLNEGLSLRKIAIQINKNPSTVGREILQRRCPIGRRTPKTLPKCVHYSECTVRGLCTDIRCVKYMCRSCSTCKEVCPDYIPGSCPTLESTPYVCNGCSKSSCCTYDRILYMAKYADDLYHSTLTGSREGINQTPEKLDKIDKLVAPLIHKGQSISHIYSTHAEDIGCSRTTLYSYIDHNILSVKNIDLPRKVKYKPRKKSTTYTNDYADFRKQRTYEDFCKYMAENPNIPVVEMDTVIGKTESKKVLLTLFFRNCSLMLIILLPNKSQGAVISALNMLCDDVGIEHFRKLFPVLLTDNGSEFQNPEALECDRFGELKTKVFYCHPNSSWEKGMIEKNHEFIRYIIPKGRSFDKYTQEDITLLMNHINSIARDSLNGCTPYKLSRYLLDNKLHDVMGLTEIVPDDVILKPYLLNKH